MSSHPRPHANRSNSKKVHFWTHDPNKLWNFLSEPFLSLKIKRSERFMTRTWLGRFSTAQKSFSCNIEKSFINYLLMIFIIIYFYAFSLLFFSFSVYGHCRLCSTPLWMCSTGAHVWCFMHSIFSWKIMGFGLIFTHARILTSHDLHDALEIDRSHRVGIAYHPVNLEL